MAAQSWSWNTLLALMIIAPWGRASPECSIWCVLDQAVESWFSDESS
jgi:hypothetical protein